MQPYLITPLQGGVFMERLQVIACPRVAPEQEPVSAQCAAGSATHHESRKGGAGAGEIRFTTDIVCAEASPNNFKTENVSLHKNTDNTERTQDHV